MKKNMFARCHLTDFLKSGLVHAILVWMYVDPLIWSKTISLLQFKPIKVLAEMDWLSQNAGIEKVFFWKYIKILAQL